MSNPFKIIHLFYFIRYNWSHGIASRKFDKVNNVIIPRQRRLSLTLRQILSPGDLPSNRLNPSYMEQDHVFKVYDSIAVHWNHTRSKRKVHWNKVKDFLEILPKGSLVAGNQLLDRLID